MTQYIARADFRRAGSPRVISTDTQPETLVAFRANPAARSTAAREFAHALLGVAVVIGSAYLVWYAFGVFLEPSDDAAWFLSGGGAR